MSKKVDKEIEDLKKSVGDKGFLGTVFGIVVFALIIIFGWVIFMGEQ
jgi:hypothetical protein